MTELDKKCLVFNLEVEMKIVKLIVLMIVLMLGGCGIVGTIDKSTTTLKSNGDTVTDRCTATYINNSFGTAANRAVNGCDASGSSTGTDNSASISVPIEALKTLLQSR